MNQQRKEKTLSERLNDILKRTTVQVMPSKGSHHKATSAEIAGVLIEEIVQRNEDFKNRFEVVESMLRTVNQQNQLIVAEMNKLRNVIQAIEQNNRLLVEAAERAEQSHTPEDTELKGE